MGNFINGYPGGYGTHRDSSRNKKRVGNFECSRHLELYNYPIDINKHKGENITDITKYYSWKTKVRRFRMTDSKWPYLKIYKYHDGICSYKYISPDGESFQSLHHPKYGFFCMYRNIGVRKSSTWTLYIPKFLKKIPIKKWCGRLVHEVGFYTDPCKELNKIIHHYPYINFDKINLKESLV